MVMVSGQKIKKIQKTRKTTQSNLIINQEI
jgi:hypothetical protein